MLEAGTTKNIHIPTQQSQNLLMRMIKTLAIEII